MQKFYTSKTLMKMAGGRMYTPGPHPTPGSAPCHELQKSSKESGIFQILGTISFVLFFTERESQKKGALWRIYQNKAFAVFVILFTIFYV